MSSPDTIHSSVQSAKYLLANNIRTLSTSLLQTKSIYLTEWSHRLAYRLSIIVPIVTISRLSIASLYRTSCTKSIVIAYNICYNQPLYCGLPGGHQHLPPFSEGERSSNLRTWGKRRTHIPMTPPTWDPGKFASLR
jgi:hypothetical protein